MRFTVKGHLGALVMILSGVFLVIDSWQFIGTGEFAVIFRVTFIGGLVLIAAGLWAWRT